MRKERKNEEQEATSRKKIKIDFVGLVYGIAILVLYTIDYFFI